VKFIAILRFSVIVIATIVVLALISAVIVYPLWFSSQADSDFFAMATISSVIVLVSILFIFRLFRSIKETRADEFYNKLFKIFLFLGFGSIQALFACAFILALITWTSPELYSSIPFIFAGIFFIFSAAILLLSLKKQNLLKTGGFWVFCSLNLVHAFFWSVALLSRGYFIDAAIAAAGISGTLVVTLYGNKLFDKKTGLSHPSA